MRIRDAESTDVDSIVALDHNVRLDRGRADFIAHAIASETCLVAESDGRVLGYGVLEYTFFSNGFISIVYVDDRERQQGVGSALLRALIARCNTQKLFTSTNESNLPMQALLEQFGFIPSGVIYNLDPGDHERVYFMQREVITS